MAWTAISPVGTLSVKANRPTMAANTAYITQYMGSQPVGTNTSPQTAKDHFWNVGGDEDGHHRFIQSTGFTSNAVSPNDVYPVIAPGMQSCLFPLVMPDGRTQWIHKNSTSNSSQSSTMYQVTPRHITGTQVITGSFTTVVALPANTYGDIYMFRSSSSSGSTHGQAGWYRSNGDTVEAWAFGQDTQDVDPITARPIYGTNLTFGNGQDASGLNLRVKRNAAASGNTWNYIVTCRYY